MWCLGGCADDDCMPCYSSLHCMSVPLAIVIVSQQLVSCQYKDNELMLLTRGLQRRHTPCCLRWRARNVTRAHSRDHAHYKSVHYFLIRLKNQVSDLAGLFFADSSSTGCSRGLHRQIATNERHIGVSPLQLYKNGNFNLIITLFPLNFAV